VRNIELISGTVVVPVDVSAGNEANEKQVMANPLKMEAYHFLACLMQKRGFQPDFLYAMFGPLLLNKNFRLDGDIREAVKLWCSDPAAAEQKYDYISKWDVSREQT